MAATGNGWWVAGDGGDGDGGGGGDGSHPCVQGEFS